MAAVAWLAVSVPPGRVAAQAMDATHTMARHGASTDSAAIRAASLDYIEGWYEADAERMSRALHPELTKQLHLILPDSASGFLQSTGASGLVASTALGGGSATPAAERRAEVTILDIFGAAASVRIDATDWIDYLHLVRTPDGWKILNVLWELREPWSPPR